MKQELSADGFIPFLLYKTKKGKGFFNIEFLRVFNKEKLRRIDNMLIPTIEKLFEHKCLFKDMKLSGFNPESLSYYCGVCGGKLSLNKTKKADEYIKAKANLKLSRQLYLLCTEPEDLSSETPNAAVEDKPVQKESKENASEVEQVAKKATVKKNKKNKKR